MRRHLAILVLVLVEFGRFAVGATVPPKRTAADYARDLESTDRNARREAAYQLSRMGREARVALPQLIKALEDDQQQVWYGSVCALAQLGPEAEPALPALLKELKAWQPFRKDRQGGQALYRTALALGSIGPAAVPALSNALTADSWFVRAGAAMALGFAGTPALPTAPALVRLLEDERVEVRNAAVEALAGMGPSVVSRLVELLGNAEESRSRVAVVGTLQRLGTNATSALPVVRRAWTGETNVEVRVAALTALPPLGLQGQELLGCLREAARDPQAQVRDVARALLVHQPMDAMLPVLRADLAGTPTPDRELAARLVAEIGPDARGVADALVAGLAADVRAGRGVDPWMTRAMAALGDAGVHLVFAELERRGATGTPTNDWTLAVLRQVNGLTWKALAGGLTNPVAAVRVGALDGLARLGSEARGVARRLPSMLADPDAVVRARTWDAAAACGVPADALVAALHSGLADSALEVRRSAVAAMGRLGPPARGAVSNLVAELDGPDPGLRREVVRALGALESEAAPAVEALATRLAGAGTELQPEILATLGRIGVPAAPVLDRMTALASAEASDVRRALAEALGRLAKAARPALGCLTNAAVDPVPAVRAAAIRAVAAVDAESPGTLATAMAGLGDSEGTVRRAAATALVLLEERARPAEARLFELLASDEDRPAARDALRAVHPVSVPALLEAFRHADWTVREMAADALARLGKDAGEAVPVLEKGMREDARDEVRRAARRAVRRIREG